MEASSLEQDVLPGGYVLAFLPALGSTRRNPSFWSDLDVRRMVIATHRQMTIEEARARIASKLGADRTPSKSALARAWKRLDKALAVSLARPVRAGR